MENIPTSDIQHVASVLARVMTGDQITAAESHRLREIAEHGRTIGSPVPSTAAQVVDPAAFAGATRSTRPLDG